MMYNTQGGMRTGHGRFSKRSGLFLVSILELLEVDGKTQILEGVNSQFAVKIRERLMFDLQ